VVGNDIRPDPLAASGAVLKGIALDRLVVQGCRKLSRVGNKETFIMNEPIDFLQELNLDNSISVRELEQRLEMEVAQSSMCCGVPDEPVPCQPEPGDELSR
jgi:hypothetical protein